MQMSPYVGLAQQIGLLSRLVHEAQGQLVQGGSASSTGTKSSHVPPMQI
jgi:hypothetical protein